MLLTHKTAPPANRPLQVNVSVQSTLAGQTDAAIDNVAGSNIVELPGAKPRVHFGPIDMVDELLDTILFAVLVVDIERMLAGVDQRCRRLYGEIAGSATVQLDSANPDFPSHLYPPDGETVEKCVDVRFGYPYLRNACYALTLSIQFSGCYFSNLRETVGVCEVEADRCTADSDDGKWWQGSLDVFLRLIPVLLACPAPAAIFSSLWAHPQLSLRDHFLPLPNKIAS